MSRSQTGLYKFLVLGVILVVIIAIGSFFLFNAKTSGYATYQEDCRKVAIDARKLVEQLVFENKVQGPWGIFIAGLESAINVNKDVNRVEGIYVALESLESGLIYFASSVKTGPSSKIPKYLTSLKDAIAQCKQMLQEAPFSDIPRPMEVFHSTSNIDCVFDTSMLILAIKDLERYLSDINDNANRLHNIDATIFADGARDVRSSLTFVRTILKTFKHSRTQYPKSNDFPQFNDLENILIGVQGTLGRMTVAANDKYFDPKLKEELNEVLTIINQRIYDLKQALKDLRAVCAKKKAPTCPADTPPEQPK